MTDAHGVTVSVLGFREDGEWCALALEMDLRGYGQTFEDALEDLQESMTMQIGFAHFKGETDMIFHPAEPVYFSLFAQVRSDHMMTLAKSGSPAASEYAVAGMPIPPAHAIAARKDEFSIFDG